MAASQPPTDVDFFTFDFFFGMTLSNDLNVSVIRFKTNLYFYSRTYKNYGLEMLVVRFARGNTMQSKSSAF